MKNDNKKQLLTDEDLIDIAANSANCRNGFTTHDYINSTKNIEVIDSIILNVKNSQSASEFHGFSKEVIVNELMNIKKDTLDNVLTMTGNLDEIKKQVGDNLVQRINNYLASKNLSSEDELINIAVNVANKMRSK